MRNFCAVLLLVLLITNCAPSSTGAEASRSGADCIGPDGSIPALSKQIQQKLNDPNSLEVHGTRVMKTTSSNSPALKEFELVLIDYGARNSFGGMVRNEALGVLIPRICTGIIFSLDAAEFIQSGSYEAVFEETFQESIGKPHRPTKGGLDEMIQRSRSLFDAPSITN